MSASAELLFLCWGSSLWTAVRPVPSAFHEPRYMGFAIHNELIFSTMFHLFRYTASSTSIFSLLMQSLSLVAKCVMRLLSQIQVYLPPSRLDVAALLHTHPHDHHGHTGPAVHSQGTLKATHSLPGNVLPMFYFFLGLSPVSVRVKAWEGGDRSGSVRGRSGPPPLWLLSQQQFSLRLE